MQINLDIDKGRGKHPHEHNQQDEQTIECRITVPLLTLCYGALIFSFKLPILKSEGKAFGII